MAPQCCRDSVAMWLLRQPPVEGAVVECRWNKGCADGYGLYKDGAWSFHEGFDTGQFIARESAPAAIAERQAFLTHFRGTRLARAMKD